MNIENSEIASVLSRVADLLEIQGANPFRVRAYRNAARTVAAHGTPLHDMVAQGADVTDLSGIGDEMADHIHELVRTGKLGRLEELEQEVPPSLADLTQVAGLGPKRARQVWKELGVETIDQLAAAASEGKLAELEGFGEKLQGKVVKGIAEFREHQARTRLSDADAVARPLVEHLRAVDGVKSVDVAGSFRRRRETVGDLDLLAIATKPAAVMKAFTSYRRVKEVVQAGDTRATVKLDTGLQIDLRVLDAKSYGAALLYFTGSKAHNVKLRTRAVDAGLKLSEYGLFKGSRRIAGKSEEEVYEALGLPWMPPELREDRGEIEAAEVGTLPDLIDVDDLRGDLQMHSTWSDGHDALEEMVAACAARGYDYCAITDHSKHLAMTGGMDAKALARQQKALAKILDARDDIRVFKSMEIDILKDGTLDLSDAGIDSLDIVLVSVHSHFDLSASAQTKRILRAITDPRVHIFAHPTGRLINEREPYPFDMEEVMHAAKEHHVAMEINAHPERLDLNDVHAMRARELGVMLAIDTDAHRANELDLIHYGVEQARRAWVEPGDVLNTFTVSELEQWLTKAASPKKSNRKQRSRKKRR